MSFSSTSQPIKITKINVIFASALALFLVPVLVLSFLGNFGNSNNLEKLKTATAAGANTGDLVIGTKDTGNAIELSVCVKATPGPFRLSQVSNWFKFDPSVLTPTPSTFLEKGQYGNTATGLNGYTPIKWQEVAGTLNTASTPNSNTFTMSLAYSGDPLTPGSAGLFMSTTTPELFGKVSFAKVANAAGSSAITMVKNQFYTIENNIPLIQQVINVSGDCRSGSVVTTSSSNALASSVSSAASSTSSCTNVSNSTNSCVVASNGNGGSISITTPPIPSTSPSQTGLTTPAINAQNTNNQQPLAISNQNTITATNQNLIATSNSTFKSQVKITDPYICGNGSYGNVPDHTKFGVDNVYYDLYKSNSTSDLAYSFKLKLNANGDFYLPISAVTNKVLEGNYRVVFYAVDKDGGRAEGEYKAFITDNCGVKNKLQNTVDKLESVRTGGLSTFSIVILLSILVSFGYLYIQSKNKKLMYNAENSK